MSDYRVWAISGHISLSMKKKKKRKSLSRMGNCTFSNSPWVRKSRHSPGDVFLWPSRLFCNPKGIEQPDLKVNDSRAPGQDTGCIVKVHGASGWTQPVLPWTGEVARTTGSGRARSHLNAIDVLSQQPENLTWASVPSVEHQLHHQKSYIYWVLLDARHTNPWVTCTSW